MGGKLLELAARCEVATGPDAPYSLSQEIGEACGMPKAYQHPGSENPTYPNYCTSLDAAMMLVPEGSVWTLDGGYTRVMNSAEIGLEPTGGEMMQPIARGEGETPALALCAAALRARSQTSD